MRRCALVLTLGQRQAATPRACPLLLMFLLHPNAPFSHLFGQSCQLRSESFTVYDRQWHLHGSRNLSNVSADLGPCPNRSQSPSVFAPDEKPVLHFVWHSEDILQLLQRTKLHKTNPSCIGTGMASVPTIHMLENGRASARGNISAALWLMAQRRMGIRPRERGGEDSG